MILSSNRNLIADEAEDVLFKSLVNMRSFLRKYHNILLSDIMFIRKLKLMISTGDEKQFQAHSPCSYSV